MATTKAPDVPPVLATKATQAPVAATPVPVAKESPLHIQPQTVTRKTSLPIDNSKTTPSPPVKDILKSPVNGHTNGHANGHGKPQSKSGTPHSPLNRHPSGGDHMHHGQGCVCHKCSGGDYSTVHHHGQGCTCHRCIRGVNEVTHISEPYCPNPSLPNITKDYETKVRIIQRIPEMRKVEKTFFVKQLVHEDRTTTVKKSRIIMVDVEEWVQVPVIKEVPRLKTIKVHKIREEIHNHTYEVPVIEYERRSTLKQIPRVCMVDVEEEIACPVIKVVPVTVKVQIPTGEFCENPIEEYYTPGDFNLLSKDGRHHGDHHKHRSESSNSSSKSSSSSSESSSSSSSDSESDDKESHSSKHGKVDVPKPTNTKPVQDYGPKKHLSPVKTKPVPADTKPSGDTEPKVPGPHDKPHEDPKSNPKPHDKQHSDPKLKSEPHMKPHEDPKPHSKPQDGPYPESKSNSQPHEKPLEDPKSKLKPEPQDKLHEGLEPKPKPHEEPKPKSHEEPKPKPHEEPKPKPHAEPKPKSHEEPKPKPHEEPKPKPHEDTLYPDIKPDTREEPHDTKPKAPSTEGKPKLLTSNAPKRSNAVDTKPKVHEDDSSKKVDSPTNTDDVSKRTTSLLHRIIHPNQSQI